MRQEENQQMQSPMPQIVLQSPRWPAMRLQEHFQMHRQEDPRLQTPPSRQKEPPPQSQIHPQRRRQQKEAQQGRQQDRRQEMRQRSPAQGMQDGDDPEFHQG